MALEHSLNGIVRLCHFASRQVRALFMRLVCRGAFLFFCVIFYHFELFFTFVLIFQESYNTIEEQKNMKTTLKLININDYCSGAYYEESHIKVFVEK